MKQTLITLTLAVFISMNLSAQGVLSGNLKTSVNFFQRDSNIKADDNPLYDNLLSGGEGWLNLTYSHKGFVGNVRFDAFNNSNLLNPTGALSGSGLGMFSLSKEFQNLTITAGHVYDQIGTGFIFRAYEDRGLLIDQALFGIHVKYVVSSHLRLKAFTGQTKNIFERYKPILKGASLEGDVDFAKGKAHITPGIGITNRTMDEGSISTLVSNINALPEEKRFVPTYNNYAASLYNTLNWGDYTWFVEGAMKSKEAINNNGNLENRSGYAGYTSVSMAKAKFGVSVSGKFTSNFVMRTSPNEILLRGLYNWQPIIAQIRTQRLIARYTPPSLDISEWGTTLNSFITPNDNLTINLTYTHVDRLDNEKLYREIWADAELHQGEKWIFHLGAQYMYYNQALYQVKNKEEYPDVQSITPFSEVVYKINKKKSIRLELQYMHTKQDYGSWSFALLEYNISPKWSFALSDMYNIVPNKAHVKEANHYPNIFIAHTRGAHRITAQYVKQVDGINCTGGVCRYEPAFSGYKIGLTSTF